MSSRVAAALQELVNLKALKDEQGKTEDYEERQPKAWAEARAALTEYNIHQGILHSRQRRHP